MNSKQLWPKCYFAHWTQHGGAAVGPDRTALMAQHSELTVQLLGHKEPRCGPVCWAQSTGKTQSCCSHLSKSLSLHQLGPTTLVYPCTTYLSSGIFREYVHVWKVGTNRWLALTRFPPKASSGNVWQAWALVTLDWIIISLAPPSSPSPSCLFALFYFHTTTLCLSQGLGLAPAPTATVEEGENSNNTKHRASAYSGTKLEFEIRCKSPSGIIALVTG